MKLQDALFAPPEQAGQDFAGWNLARLARSSVAVPVESAALGATVLFAGDRAAIEPAEQRIVYRAAELRELALAKPTADELRLIHELKDVFRGRVVPEQEVLR